MARADRGHPTVRELYAQRLVGRGRRRRRRRRTSSWPRCSASCKRRTSTLKVELRHTRQPSDERHAPARRGDSASTRPSRRTGCARSTRRCSRVPDGFTVHPKLAQQLERRRTALDEGGIDWGHAEALAFASLLVEGIPIRLTGQDTRARHVLAPPPRPPRRRDGRALRADAAPRGAARVVRGAQLAALRATPRSASSTATRSPPPEALVLWEAQFGDFVNGAQIDHRPVHRLGPRRSGGRPHG